MRVAAAWAPPWGVEGEGVRVVILVTSDLMMRRRGCEGVRGALVRTDAPYRQENHKIFS